MTDDEFLAQRFESHRAQLRAAAYRMLGSAAEAEDAVQEAWIRLGRSDASAVENLGAWLTTVVARVCLDMLRSRASRREDGFGDDLPPTLQAQPGPDDPAHATELADTIGIALLVVLEQLTPAERVAFVLHDTFAVPFEEIATIVGRSPDATRQLASRARRRVRGTNPDDVTEGDDPRRHREIVRAFLAAAQDGQFAALVAMLDPSATMRADAAAIAMGTPAELVGPDAVAGMFSGRAQAAELAVIDGEPGLMWARRGRPQVVFAFTIVGGRITGIELIADADHIEALGVTAA